MRLHVRIVAIAVLLSAAAVTLAQQPEITHAQLTTKSADRGLAAEFDALKRTGVPVWVGYNVPVVDRFSSGWSSDRVSYLEGRPSSVDDSNGDGNRASFDHAVILLRIAGSGVEKIRVESPDRQLDGGGLRFMWLNNVDGDDSVNALASLAKQDEAKKLRDSAVFAISIHRTPAATQSLIALASSGSDPGLREKTAFWLANERGHDGFVAIQRFAREDSDPVFREKLAFDLNLSKDPDAVKELVRMAHSDAAPGVRKQAQFWMAQKGGKLVAGDLHDMAENDPEAGIRKSAVFAISRLPGDEATTQLIQLAKTGKDPGVRKQAVFWLGQSKDPRALDYLTELIQH